VTLETIRVGDIVVHPIYDGTAVLTTDMWAGSDWTAHRHLLDDSNRLVVPVGAFLVRVGDKLLLLDAGVGDVRDDMFEGGQLLQSLAAAGATPADIDVIVVSHLHSDHMGWLESDGASVFPRATIRVGAADWEHFVEGPAAASKRAARMRTVENQVELIESDGAAILPGVTTRSTPGHTPGHTSTVVASGAEHDESLGDAVHCPAQLTETEWQFVFDVDAELAVRTRQALLRDAEQPGTVLLPCHFPGMQAARLVAANGSRRWVMGEPSTP
jgi:glyoxylase-like metal-dependent hydrolase (beta-lactamase superfamily II)